MQKIILLLPLILFTFCTETETECDRIFHNLKIKGAPISCDCITINKENYYKPDDLMDDYFYRLEASLVDTCEANLIKRFAVSPIWQKGQVDSMLLDMMHFDYPLLPEDYYYFLEYEKSLSDDILYNYKFCYYDSVNNALNYIGFAL